MDAYGKLERAEHEIFCLEEAAEYLEQVHDCEDLVQIVKDRLIVLNFAKEEYHRRVEMIEAAEERALVREYYRSVI